MEIDFEQLRQFYSERDGKEIMNITDLTQPHTYVEETLYNLQSLRGTIM